MALRSVDAPIPMIPRLRDIQAALRIVRIPVWVFDIERAGMAWANPPALELWIADSVDDLIRRDFASDMSASTRIRLADYLHRFSTGAVAHEQWTMYPQGVPTTVDCACSGVELDDGRVAMLVQATLLGEPEPDATTLRGVEALRHTTVLISLISMDGEVLMENPAALRQYGFTAGTERVHGFVARFHDPHQGILALECVRRGEVYSAEIRVRSRGTERWHGLDARIVRDPATGNESILVNEKDVTRRVRAEAELVESRETLEQTVAARTAELQAATESLAAEKAFISTVLDTVGSLVVVTNPRGEVVRVNQRVEELCGLAAPDIEGKIVWEVLGRSPDLAALRDTHAAIRAQRACLPLHSETHVRSCHGRDRLVAWTHTVLADPEGGPKLVVAAGLDITDRREMQLQLQLGERLVSVGTLAAGIAHEINNPLTCVLGNLELLTDFAQPDDDPRHVRQLLAETLDGSRRVRDIVEELRAFSEPRRESKVLVDVQQPLQSALRMAAHQIRPRAQLIKELEQAPMVRAESSKLGQVFLNLLLNAAHAIPEGNIERNRIVVRSFEDDSGNAVIQVRDSGAGIAPENLGRIFQPFFTTRAEGLGSGMGLAISHRIVEMFGGRIQVESTVGQGSTFSVVLPPGEVSSAKSVTKQSSPRVGTVSRVLAIDDEVPILRVIERVLSRRYQAKVVTTTSAHEALRILREQGPFDVIFCDLMMPEMTGMDFHSVLSRELPDCVDSLVFMTGGTFTPRAAAFLEEVENPVLEKPFDMASVLRAVRTILSTSIPPASS